MTRTLEQKLAALSPARSEKVETRTAELVEDETSLCDLRRTRDAESLDEHRDAGLLSTTLGNCQKPRRKGRMT